MKLKRKNLLTCATKEPTIELKRKTHNFRQVRRLTEITPQLNIAERCLIRNQQKRMKAALPKKLIFSVLPLKESTKILRSKTM